MESEIEAMRNSVADLKKQPKEKKKVGRDKPMPSSSSKMAKVSSSKSSSSKKKGKKAVADDDVLTFDQKKDLSEAISRLEGSKLERVIQIIHEGVPEIRDVSACHPQDDDDADDILLRALKRSSSRLICCRRLS